VRLAVVGARGQLAAAVIHECAATHEVVTFTRQELDVSDDAAVGAAMDRVRPDVIVNGAAFNDVDAAESRPVEALNANAFGARALARAAGRHGAVFIHYSSDFVFDGTASAPYTELDRPNPRSVYAASKLLGEWFALDVPRDYVLRVETLFGRAPNGLEAKGSVAVIRRTLLDGGSPRVFVDRTISPTYVLDAARATRQLVESTASPGLYHCVNSGNCTWFEFAAELARLLEMPPNLTAVRMADIVRPAQRPQYCALSNEKLRSVGIEMPPWQDALARYVHGTLG